MARTARETTEVFATTSARLRPRSGGGPRRFWPTYFERFPRCRVEARPRWRTHDRPLGPRSWAARDRPVASRSASTAPQCRYRSTQRSIMSPKKAQEVARAPRGRLRVADDALARAGRGPQSSRSHHLHESVATRPRCEPGCTVRGEAAGAHARRVRSDPGDGAGRGPVLRVAENAPYWPESYLTCEADRRRRDRRKWGMPRAPTFFPRPPRHFLGGAQPWQLRPEDAGGEW